jgi:peptide/nickel transport system permease protein
MARPNHHGHFLNWIFAPVFFVGLLLLVFVIVRWNLLPYPDYESPFDDPVAFFQTMLLPWVTLAILYAAYYARLTRSQMLETMGEDYIRTARAKGLSERVVFRKHAFRAGLTPIVTSAGLDLAGLLGGAVITEYIFSLPGLGRLAIGAVTEYDLPTITATVLVAAVFVIVANLVVDILYAAIDPRVRLT